MPKSPRPASLSGEESVEVATPTLAWVPKGKERAVERWHPTMCEAVLGVKRPVEGDVDVDAYDTSSSLESPKKRKKCEARRELIPKSRIERAVPRGGGRPRLLHASSK